MVFNLLQKTNQNNKSTGSNEVGVRKSDIMLTVLIKVYNQQFPFSLKAVPAAKNTYAKFLENNAKFFEAYSISLYTYEISYDANIYRLMNKDINCAEFEKIYLHSCLN